MKPLFSFLCVVAGALLGCGADPAFHEVSRDTGGRSQPEQGEQKNANQGTENDANANAVPPSAHASGDGDLPKDRPAAVDNGPFNENHPPKPNVPEGKTLVKLQVQQFQTTAWFKDCLVVTLNDESQKVGCNKDPDSADKWIYLLADKAPACNRVSIKIETTFNVGDNCSLRAAQGLACNGPYGSVPDRTRTLNDPADKDFFKVYDAFNIDTHDPLVQSTFDWLQLKKEMVGYAGSEKSVWKNVWKRVFVEDLSRKELDTALKNPAQADTQSVNFSDVVFDLKGEDVKLSLEGLDSGCAP